MTTKAKVLLWVGIVLVGLPLLLVILISTPPVTRLVVRKVLPKLNAQLNGRLAVDGISGSLLSGLQLRGVTLRDPEGEVVLQAERVNVRYSVWDLLHSKISLGPILLERPIVRLLKDHPGEQYSILRVFAKGDTTNAKPGTVDFTIKDLELREGSIIATVWRQPAAPQQEVAQGLDTVQVIGVNLTMPLIHYSASATEPRAALAQIASASGHLVDPELELYELRGDAQMHGDSITLALSSVRLPHSQLKAEAWMVTLPEHRRFDATAHVADLSAGDIKSFISGAEIPAEWHFRGDLRTTSLSSGSVLVQGRNLDFAIAGGTVTGHVTVQGQDNEWSARNSRLDVAGVEVERLLKAFHVPSNLRAQLGGYVTAEGKGGTADLQVAGVAGYGVHGPIHGHLYASGNMDALEMQTELAGGGIGSIQLSGRAATGKHLRLSDLRGTLQRFNLAAVDARMPESSINGQIEGDVVFGSMPREAHLRMFLDSSTIRGIMIDTALIIAHVDSGLLHADSVLLRTPGLQMTGAGTFGLSEDQTGDLTLTLDAPSLAEVEPLLASFTRDTVVNLDGALQVGLTASGSLTHYTLGLEAVGRDISVNGFQVDSLTAKAGGTPDSLLFNATAAVDSATVVSVSGRYSTQAVMIDSLELDRGEASWRLEQGARAQMAQGKWTFDSVVLARDPAPGQLTIAGAWPGQITVTAEHLPIADLLRKGNRDSLPDIDAKATYADGAVTGTLDLLTSDGRKPLSAEFATKPLHGRLLADSFDLGIVAPLMPSIKQLGGSLDGDVSVEGAMDAPRLNGSLTLRGGTASVPATGVRYHDAYAILAFAGDAMQLDSMEVFAGKGRAQIDGHVRFAKLDHPELDITVRTDRFPVLQRRDFLAATATGDLRLKGSPAGASLTGKATVNEGTAFLESFLRSSGIDLSNPLYAQFVDTTVLREAIPSNGLIDAFMDSLRVDSLSVDLGDRFWLRSPDASIQLAGQLTVRTPRRRDSTSADPYRLVGTVKAVRGIYRMALAPGLTREFTIREGTIRYFGAPKTDAILDLTAEHVVRTATGDRVTITVKIGGSLALPTLAFSSDVSPPLSETEIISYLVFGAPTAQAFLGNEGQAGEHHSVFETSAQQLAGVLSGKIESAVQSQLGLPIDYFRIKPGEVQSGLAGTELVLGMQVRIFGYPSFLRASPRFCPREQLLSLDHVGIDLETRLSKQWGVATSVDPVQACEAVMSGTAARPYQFGFDVFWEKR